MKYISDLDYLESLAKSLQAYEPHFRQDKKALFFKVYDQAYELYSNGNAIILMNCSKTIHIVPIMLSTTDICMMSYIKNFILCKQNLYKQILCDQKEQRTKQISIFDLGVDEDGK